MKKKIYFIVLALIAIMGISVITTSCGKDDDNEIETTDINWVGKWKLVCDGHDEDVYEWIVTINKDYSFSMDLDDFTDTGTFKAITNGDYAIMFKGSYVNYIFTVLEIVDNDHVTVRQAASKYTLIRI